MKQKVLIEDNGKVIFKGKVLNIPIKQEKIIEKSIDLFDDDDPCIIHTSFILKHYAEELLSLFEQHQVTKLNGKDYKNALDFLDVSSIEHVTISLI